ncbi:replication terminator protein [Paenibacillus sp. FSL R10-2734]|uniref:replication terminator protein n=1 Tax=Paenibacillus sp. FSL R10-2734 TaxID=2954691 RepID=UPI0030D9746F
MSKEINFNNLAEGAVGERLNIEMQKLAANVLDPNTNWKNVRKLTLTIAIKPNEKREIGSVDIDVKTALAPAKGVSTTIIFGMDNEGKAQAAELVSGVKDQMMIDNDGDVADDRGNKVDQVGQKESNVVNFK